MAQKNKDKIDKTAEDITKNLFDKTFNLNEEEQFEENDMYYKKEYFEDDDDFQNKERLENTSKNSSRKKSTKSYRKNIDEYGKKFFEDDEDDEIEKSSFGKILNFAVMVVLVISTSVLAFSLMSAKKEIETLEEENQNLLIKNQDAENKLLQDSLKNQIAELEAKNEELQNIIAKNETPNSSKNNTEAKTETTTQSKPQNNTTEKPNKTNSNNSSFSEYTVKENDSFWKISKAVYGTGSKYQLIINANNLTENSKLTPGQKLKIPKSN